MELNSLQWHVMDATADDWESLAQIMPHVDQWHGRTDPEVVAGVIQDLVAAGLLEEAEGRTATPADIASEPDRLWFSMTKPGRDLWDRQGDRFRNE